MLALMAVPIMAERHMRGQPLVVAEGAMPEVEPQAWQAGAKYRHRVIHCNL